MNMENNSKHNNSLIILLSVLLLISCIIAGLFAYQVQNLAKEIKKLKTEELTTQTPSPTPDPVVNWKTYTNEKYRFSFNYPSDLPIDENSVESEGYLQLIFNKSVLPNNFIITARTKYLPNDVKNLHDSKPVDSLYVNSNKWGIFMLSAEDGFQIEKNKVLYTIIYPNSKKAAVDQIIYTFKFLDEEIALPISVEELSKGWYWGDINQKKINTPDDWVFKEAGRSSCWHKVGVICQ